MPDQNPPDDLPEPPDGAETAEGQDNRRFRRAQVDMVVRLRFGNVQQFLDATAGDLSVGGMFLRSEHALPGGQLRVVGQLVKLQFDAGSRRVVEGVGRIVRVVPPSPVPGAVPGVGIEFVELDERSRELIKAVVAIKLAGSEEE